MSTTSAGRDQPQHNHQQQQQGSLLDVIAAMSDAVLAIDDAGVIELANPAASDLFGRPSTDLVGLPFGFPVLGGESARLEVLAGGGPAVVELRVSRTEWHRRAVWLATLRDVTEREATARALAEAHAELARRSAELERSNADLTQFAYVASHDLQAPLHTVRGFAELLEDRYRDRLDADGVRFLELMITSIERMEALITDLLAYSRIDSEPTVRRPVDGEALVRSVLLTLRQAVTESGAVITHGPLPVVSGDRRQLERVVQNLVGNAIAYVAAGTRPEVHITAEPEPGAWRFVVSDNGVGVPERERERIFEMLRRLQAAAAHPGTGLGLAISKRIVERHGGRIWVEGNPGGGSRFCFTVPDGAGVEPSDVIVLP